MFKLFLIISCSIYVITCWPNFELYTKSRPNQYIQVKPSNLVSFGFSHSKDTKFIVHGFSSDSNALIEIKNQFLYNYDFNIIVIDWKLGAQAPDYYSAFINTREVGQKMASFIRDANITASKVHCIGHSLGAHICGFTGKSRRIGRITGLDPAGPLFKGKPYYSRLDKEDADFVDVIHTDSELGIQDSIGHLDFYPNGGASQAGCLFRSNDLVNSTNDDNKIIQFRIEPRGDVLSFFSCSHTRSNQLFAQSISKCPFKSVQCLDYNAFKSGACRITTCLSSLEGCPSMGFKAQKYFTNGKYYLDTTKSSPFC
ncbi:unnamed protein product [Brachionus calyciflorus]|uniref:Lipase domain-containing protein n=1 Tax=Brachionus calyciflorus TaxID=104777 RepID=A0A813SZK5_9BILA|nr:unnamed protein product [Brachionus calyciflorus]